MERGREGDALPSHSPAPCRLGLLALWYTAGSQMPEQPSAPSSSLATRVVSALVGGPLVLALVLWPGGGGLFFGSPFALFVLLLVLFGLKEFSDACRQPGFIPRDG